MCRNCCAAKTGWSAARCCRRAFRASSNPAMRLIASAVDPSSATRGSENREARRFRDDQPMQCDRVRRQRGAQDERCQSKEDLLDARTLEQRRIGGRTQSIDDPMDHRSEQRGLVFEAVIEGALRNARSSRDRLDARRTIAVAQKLVRRDVEDPLAELLRCRPRRTPPAAGATPVRRQVAPGRLSLSRARPSSWRRAITAGNSPAAARMAPGSTARTRPGRNAGRAAQSKRRS